SQYSLYFQHQRACPDVEPLAEGTALAILGRNCQTKRYRAQTGPLCIATQALRAWLLSACPSGAKAIRPSKRHTIILALMRVYPGLNFLGPPGRRHAQVGIV